MFDGIVCNFTGVQSQMCFVSGIAVFLSGIFSIVTLHKTQCSFDAKDAIKLSASVQASFRLQMAVSELVPCIGRLEYDIYGEIGVLDTKVAILSMHRLGASNWTDVVFGVISDPINVPINAVSSSVLRSSLIELFLQEYNLTLTTTIFGEPSMFEILKFPGGITENFIELRVQLKFGLNLRPYENVYAQITNEDGSMISPTVIVQASVMSDMGILLPQRLKQLAQTISDSRVKNLDLDDSVFGKVNKVVLSSYLKGTLRASPPILSPSPSPEQSISPYPAPSPYAPSPSPDPYCQPPCFDCETSSPSNNIQPHPPSPESVPSPAPSTATAHPSCPYPCHLVPSSYSPTSNPNPSLSPLIGLPKLAPNLSPLPVVSYHSRPGHDAGIPTDLLSPSLVPSPSSLAVGFSTRSR